MNFSFRKVRLLPFVALFFLRENDLPVEAFYRSYENGKAESRIPSNILWHDNAPVSISTSRLLSDFKIDPPS